MATLRVVRNVHRKWAGKVEGTIIAKCGQLRQRVVVGSVQSFTSLDIAILHTHLLLFPKMQLLEVQSLYQKMYPYVRDAKALNSSVWPTYDVWGKHDPNRREELWKTTIENTVDRETAGHLRTLHKSWQACAASQDKHKRREWLATSLEEFFDLAQGGACNLYSTRICIEVIPFNL